MGVTMSGDEVTEFIGSHGDAVLTTIRADGRPAPLPVWYVALDGALYFRTPARAKKVANLARDPRVTVLIDDGRHWTELRGVVLQSEATVVDDDEESGRVRAAFAELFVDRTLPPERMPQASSKHYSSDVLLRVPIPASVATWDNRKIRLPS